MKTVLDELKDRAGAVADCGHDAQELARKIEKGVNEAKVAVSETLEDGKIAAERFLKQTRHAVKDGMRQTARNVKRHPFGALATVFAAGAVLGFLVPRLTKK